MKFIAPEVEIKKFNVVDVLTASASAPEPSDPVETVSQAGYIMQGECTGSAADNLVPDCV